MAQDWLADVKKYAPDADEGAVAGIVRYCGIALRKADSSMVSFSDPAELARVRTNFLKKKLALTQSDATLDEAIAAVGTRMKGDRTKNRVTVYYLLADRFGKLAMFASAKAAATGKSVAADRTGTKPATASRASGAKAAGLAAAGATGAAGAAVAKRKAAAPKTAAAKPVAAAKPATVKSAPAAKRAAPAKPKASAATAAAPATPSKSAPVGTGGAAGGTGSAAGGLTSEAAGLGGAAAGIGAAAAGAAPIGAGTTSQSATEGAGAGASRFADAATGAGGGAGTGGTNGGGGASSGGGASGNGGTTGGGASGGSGKWWPWLVLVVALIALFLLLRSCNRDETATTNVSEVTLNAADLGSAGGMAGTDDNMMGGMNTAAPDAMGNAAMPAAAPTGAGVVGETRAGLPALVVYFDTGKSDVTKDLAAAAAGVKDYVATHPGATLAVSGYNDPTGNAVANAALSKRRAQQVAAALAAAGIAQGVDRT